nr:hypothetical protein [Tanacetum cinerariifolium]
ITFFELHLSINLYVVSVLSPSGVRTGATREESNATTKQNQSRKKGTGGLDPTRG